MARARYGFGGRAVLITGGGGDIGRATARHFAADGAAVALLDADASKLAAAAEELEELGAAHRAVTCDVTDAASVDDAFAAVVADLGRVDFVFNNAGYQGVFAPTHAYPADDFRKVIDVNVVGAYNVLATSARHLRAAGGGAIVNTASHAGVEGPPNMLAYGASKAAVIAMTETAAKDLAPYGVRVNAVSPALIGPGYMWTRQTELQAATGSQYFAPDPARVREQMLATVPLRRLGTLEEVANAVAFLMSDEASYVTGFNLEVTGGV